MINKITSRYPILFFILLSVLLTTVQNVQAEQTAAGNVQFSLHAVSQPDLNRVILPEQPDELMYKATGYSLEIPLLSVTSEISWVPFFENSWAVTWLEKSSGLLEGTSLPGEGLSILTGHNHISTTEAGPFLFIKNLVVNDRIFIYTPKNEMITFSVYANELVEPTEFQKVISRAEEVPNSLVLVTCEDETIDGKYEHRRIIYAKPVL